MPPTTLDPPGIQSLSDYVIGNVRQRVLPAHRRSSSTDEGVNSFQSTVVLHANPRKILSADEDSTYKQTRSANPSLSTSVCPVKIYTGANVDKCRTQSDREFVSFNSVNIGVDEQLGLENKNEAVNEHRRKRIRLNQARYRKKLENKPKNLENKIQEMKDQIEHLQNERKQILSGMSTQKSIWDAAVTYLRIFRRGIHAPKGTGIREMTELKLLVASDVAFSSGIGLHELVNKWRVFTQHFPDVRIELKNLKQITTDSVLATTTISFTISQSSIPIAFPYLSESKRGLILSEKLHGQNLIVHGSTRFDWDNTIQRVISVHTQSDLVSILLRLLGNLEDVSHVLNSSELCLSV